MTVENRNASGRLCNVLTPLPYGKTTPPKTRVKRSVNLQRSYPGRGVGFSNPHFPIEDFGDLISTRVGPPYTFENPPFLILKLAKSVPYILSTPLFCYGN